MVGYGIAWTPAYSGDEHAWMHGTVGMFPGLPYVQYLDVRAVQRKRVAQRYEQLVAVGVQLVEGMVSIRDFAGFSRIEFRNQFVDIANIPKIGIVSIDHNWKVNG